MAIELDMKRICFRSLKPDGQDVGRNPRADRAGTIILVKSQLDP